MRVNVKKLDPNAVIPSYAHHTDAGLDLVATTLTGDDGFVEYGTGLAIEIPEGFVGLLFPRSSISNTALCLANSVGVIDAGYRGEIKLRFKLLGNIQRPIYQPGEKIGQLIVMPYPKIRLVEVNELSETSRSEGGFGSTGK